MEETAAPGALAGKRVLLVEDEYYLAEDLGRALRQLDATVLGPAPTRERALELATASEGIDLAVLDLNLRGEMAYEVAEALEARGVPFVFATGYDASTIDERFRHVPCWQKPFAASAIAQALPRLEGKG